MSAPHAFKTPHSPHQHPKTTLPTLWKSLFATCQFPTGHLGLTEGRSFYAAWMTIAFSAGGADYVKGKLRQDTGSKPRRQSIILDSYLFLKIYGTNDRFEWIRNHTHYRRGCLIRQQPHAFPFPSFPRLPESKHADSQTAPPTRKRHSPSATRTQNSCGHPHFFLSTIPPPVTATQPFKCHFDSKNRQKPPKTPSKYP